MGIAAGIVTADYHANHDRADKLRSCQRKFTGGGSNTPLWTSVNGLKIGLIQQRKPILGKKVGHMNGHKK